MIENFYQLTYREYVAFLLEKYGPAVCDYFANEQCKSKSSKISRTKEGLFCHHIDENKEILLSTPEVARLHPFEYQKKEHLVYCNIVEHLLLHVKIVQECSKDNPSLGVGGVSIITAKINGYYDNPPTSGWQINAYNVIKDSYDDYINLLSYTVNAFQNAENIFGFQAEDFCKNWDGQLIESIYQDLTNELQISSCKNNRLYVGDKVIASKIGHGIIIAMLLPEGYDEPVMIVENSNGERQPLIVTDTHFLKVVEKIKHKHTLYPGDCIVDDKYGDGVVKDVVLREDGIIITVLYDKYFCVYFDEIKNENLIEAKRINPKYQ